jgi:hypothetical protein
MNSIAPAMNGLLLIIIQSFFITTVFISSTIVILLFHHKVFVIYLKPENGVYLIEILNKFRGKSPPGTRYVASHPSYSSPLKPFGMALASGIIRQRPSKSHANPRNLRFQWTGFFNTSVLFLLLAMVGSNVGCIYKKFLYVIFLVMLFARRGASGGNINAPQGRTPPTGKKAVAVWGVWGFAVVPSIHARAVILPLFF